MTGARGKRRSMTVFFCIETRFDFVGDFQLSQRDLQENAMLNHISIVVTISSKDD